MTLLFPTFVHESTEFDCLTPDLSAVKWYLKNQRLVANRDALAMQVDKLMQEHKTSLAGVFHEIRDRLQENEAKQVNEETRVSRVSEILSQWQSLGNAVPVRTVAKKRLLIEKLSDIYRRNSIEQFTTDATIAFSDELENTGSNVELEAAQDKFKQAGYLINGHLKKAPEYLKFVPSTFRGQTVGGSFTEADMAAFVISTFVKVWRERAPLFAVPVSIYGIVIETMPPERKQLWETVYGVLELGMIPKSVCYVAMPSREPTLIDDTPKPVEQVIDNNETPPV